MRAAFYNAVVECRERVHVQGHVSRLLPGWRPASNREAHWTCMHRCSQSDTARMFEGMQSSSQCKEAGYSPDLIDENNCTAAVALYAPPAEAEMRRLLLSATVCDGRHSHCSESMQDFGRTARRRRQLFGAPRCSEHRRKLLRASEKTTIPSYKTTGLPAWTYMYPATRSTARWQYSRQMSMMTSATVKCPTNALA